MSYRTVVITKKCKLKYQNNHLVVRGEDLTRIHIKEIGVLMIDSTQVVLTTFLVSELLKNKIKIIFCDEKRLPIGEIVPYYGAHNTSKKLLNQINWKENTKKIAWQRIVSKKIEMQAKLLRKLGLEEYKMLLEYSTAVELGDSTNREGHAAKVYFNSLFPNSFRRFDNDNINGALNYGYSIIASYITKEISSLGYMTQLGINHCNEFNNFNLTYDLIEPFRPLIDEYVVKNIDRELDSDYKMELVNILNRKVKIKKKEYFLGNAITIYIYSVVGFLENDGKTNIEFVDIDGW